MTPVTHSVLYSSIQTLSNITYMSGLMQASYGGGDANNTTDLCLISTLLTFKVGPTQLYLLI